MHRTKLFSYYLTGRCKITNQVKVIISGISFKKANRLKQSYKAKQYFKFVQVKK